MAQQQVRAATMPMPPSMAATLLHAPMRVQHAQLHMVATAVGGGMCGSGAFLDGRPLKA